MDVDGVSEAGEADGHSLKSHHRLSGHLAYTAVYLLDPGHPLDRPIFHLPYRAPRRRSRTLVPPPALSYASIVTCFFRHLKRQFDCGDDDEPDG